MLKREFVIRARVNEKEIQIFERMANEEGRNMSEMLRECVRESAKDRQISLAGISKYEAKG